MTNRSANATIKGYLYQFDLAIVQLLSATKSNAAIFVEGIEDVDLSDGDDKVLIQCKYYEGTEYNHSVIKDAIIHLVRHFHGNGCKAGTKYRLYGHYKGGQTKLPSSINIDFLKKHLLTFTAENVLNEVHVELKLTDAELTTFIGALDININADSYDKQQDRIEKLLISEVNNCNKEDVWNFFYPLAVNVIQNLAIQRNEADRAISKAEFLDDINKKDAVFSNWLSCLLGEASYVRFIRRKHFDPASTKTPKASRIFIVDASKDFTVAGTASVLIKIGKRFSHVEHKRTLPQDRFCPFVFMRNLDNSALVQLKENLVTAGVKISDGHIFNGSKFSTAHLLTPPTKDNLVKLRFVQSTEQVDLVISEIKDDQVEVFEFYHEAPLATGIIVSEVLHHKIKVPSLSFIGEAI